MTDAPMTDDATMPVPQVPTVAPAPASAPAAATTKAPVQQQHQSNRTGALKGEDAWKRMNFLHQSAHRTLMMPDPTVGANLSRWYLLNLRKVATKLVLRIDPSIKNTACKRCGVLLLAGRTAATQVVSVGRQSSDDDRAAISAEDEERLREWRQDQMQQTNDVSDVPAAALNATSAAPISAAATPTATAATAARNAKNDDKPVEGGSNASLNARQRRHKQRAEARLRLAKLGDTQLQTSDSLAAASPAAASESTTAAISVAAVSAPATAASTSIVEPAATAATSAAATAMSDVTPAPAVATAAAPLVQQPTATASSSHQRHRRIGRVRMSKIAASPHVVVTCLQCHTRKRINTKPPKQRPGADK